MFDIETLHKAYQLVAPHVRQTPIISAHSSDFNKIDGDFDISFKLELTQFSGCFKTRGAIYSLLSQTKLPNAVTAASGGNHGAAVAFAAQKLGIEANIFVPEKAPQIKVDRIKQYGANVHLIGENYQAAYEASLKHIEEKGDFSIHAYNDINTIIGQSTLGFEWHQQVKNLDSVIIAVGGGGLISGVASSLKLLNPKIKIIAVETENSACLNHALNAQKPVTISPSGHAADSLGASQIGSNCFDICQKQVDLSIKISDEDVLEAQRTLWRDMNIIAEAGGAASFATINSAAYKPKTGEKIGILVCGGNAKLTDFI